MRHQFGSTFFIADAMNVAQEILFLLAGFVVREMTFNALENIVGLTYGYRLACSVLKIIYARGARQIIQLLYR